MVEQENTYHDLAVIENMGTERLVSFPNLFWLNEISKTLSAILNCLKIIFKDIQN